VFDLAALMGILDSLAYGRATKLFERRTSMKSKLATTEMDISISQL
jgi:hypothetical protein